MATSGPTSSPEGHPASLAPNNITSARTSSDDSRDPKYQAGLMPAEYAGLEVANNGDGHYQTAAPGGPGYYVPYQDNVKPPSGYDQQPYQQQQPYSQSAPTPSAYGGDYAAAPPPGKGEKRVCGIRAATFWMGLLALIFLLGTIGASAAAGTIAQQYAGYIQTCDAKLEQSATQASASAAASNSAATASASASNTASGTVSATAAAASATSTGFTSIPLPQQASSIFGEATSNCPNLSAENKTYSVPGSNLKFVRECGKNYPFNDLGYIPLTRMEDCMNLCAALSVTTQSADGPCIGVAWVTAGKQGTDQNYCWLKGAKGSPDPKANVEAAWLSLS
ncbi:hypothetical protein K4K54_001045 [Colletotrichum sp. SAR 10_86]|nr:hypothetical protein K4K52_004054 [Colletotrichum sp. SAR 10_76]KAI8237099.1 hypothetical protein K4K54_001045 [Colletotrichum sp. SAR 10_86]